MRSLAPVLVAFALAGSACGYRVVHGPALLGVSTVRVTPFAEEEPVGLSLPLAEALANRLAQSGLAIDTSDGAEATLQGRVVSAGSTVNPTLRVGSAIRAYNFMVRLEAELQSSDGTSLWRGSARVQEDYRATANSREAFGNLETEANRRRALHRLAESAADQLVEQMLLQAAANSPEEESDAAP